jgi:tripartite-type tricarboxylate transporter receptor subunit TctC
MTYGSGSSSSHAAMELYKLIEGIDIRYIPYKTSPQVSVDILGGSIDMMTSNLGTVQKLIETGKLRALAVTGRNRAPSLPNVPTMREAGVADYELTFWNAAWVPAGTPKPIVDRLNQMFVTALNRPKVKEYMEQSGNVEFPTTSDELMKFQISESAKWKRIFEASGVTPQ